MKKYFGDKNQELLGSSKVMWTQNSFIIWLMEGRIEKRLKKKWKEKWKCNSRRSIQEEIEGSRQQLLGLDWGCILGERARWLERPFEEYEIKKTIFECSKDKTPNLDRFNFAFFFPMSVGRLPKCC